MTAPLPGQDRPAAPVPLRHRVENVLAILVFWALILPPLVPHGLKEFRRDPAGWIKTCARGLVRLLAKTENALLMLVFGAMVLLPLVTVGLREFAGKPVAWANTWVQNLNLWLAMIGALVAARVGQHLKLSTGELLKFSPKTQKRVGRFTAAVAVAVTALLAIASWKFVVAMMGGAATLPGGVPKWVIQGAMPLCFGGAAIYLAWRDGRDWKGRVLAAVLVALTIALVFVPLQLDGPLWEALHLTRPRAAVVWVGTVVLVTAVAFGAPIFTVLGGLAMLLLFGKPMPVSISAVPLETFSLVASANLPAIPLFTLAGFLMAEGGASKRLVDLFQRFFGWMPGGIAVAAVIACAFFTTFTGASGVTILALGGLLYPILHKAGYSDRFAIGLLIASGSIGLLFPPSLPVILYGVVANVPIDKLFISGLVPGLLLVVLVAGMGVVHAVRHKVKRTTFEPQPALRSLRSAGTEVLLPVLVLVGYFGGFVSIFEAAALAAAYAFVSEVFIHKDLSLSKDIPRVFVQCGTMMGGVLVILGVALGFTNYLVDAEVPMAVAAWTSEHVGNKLAFIALLNCFLLLVGCLMDIYSAIVVVVPLMIPIAMVFDVHPIHLGILFLANLELGYLTPPVGMNLFLASYRFDKPLTEVYRMGLPFLAILAAGVLVIAYVPALTLWPHGDEPVTNQVSLDDLTAPDGEEGQETPALPLGEIDLDALLAPDSGAGEGEEKSALPLGELDLDALLAPDDDDSGGDDGSGGDDDSGAP